MNTEAGGQAVRFETSFQLGCSWILTFVRMTHWGGAGPEQFPAARAPTSRRGGRHGGIRGAAGPAGARGMMRHILAAGIKKPASDVPQAQFEVSISSVYSDQSDKSSGF
jgi:hypothetical protein